MPGSCANAEAPALGALPVKKTLASWQKLNAPNPMLVTLPGMVTLVRPAQELNAFSPILVTVWGMVTAGQAGAKHLVPSG